MSRLRTHPGEALAIECLKPLGRSASALRKAIGVPGDRIIEPWRPRRDMSADTAIRLGTFFGVDPRFWLNLQAAHDVLRSEINRDHTAIRRREGVAARTSVARRSSKPQRMSAAVRPVPNRSLGLNVRIAAP